MAAQNNAGAVIGGLALLVVVYLLLKNMASKAAVGTQTAGTKGTGVPTNPFAGFPGNLFGLQMPNQFGTSNPTNPFAQPQDVPEPALQTVLNEPSLDSGTSSNTNPFINQNPNSPLLAGIDSGYD